MSNALIELLNSRKELLNNTTMYKKENALQLIERNESKRKFSNNINDKLFIIITHVEVLWCEGMRDLDLFKDGEEFNSFLDFQHKVHCFDSKINTYYKNSGYAKCKYVLRGECIYKGNRELFEYTGRVDLGDGLDYCNIEKSVINSLSSVQEYGLSKENILFIY